MGDSEIGCCWCCFWLRFRLLYIFDILILFKGADEMRERFGPGKIEDG